jgi:hypothetical protein
MLSWRRPWIAGAVRTERKTQRRLCSFVAVMALGLMWNLDPVLTACVRDTGRRLAVIVIPLAIGVVTAGSAWRFQGGGHFIAGLAIVGLLRGLDCHPWGLGPPGLGPPP